MNQQWQRVPFADLLVDSRDGEWGEGVSAVGLQACDLIRGTDFSSLTDPDVSLPLRWIPDRLVERKQLQTGDIVFEMAGGTAKQSTGRSAFVGQSFLKSRQRPVLCASFCRHLRLDRERFEPRFVYYFLQALYAAGYMGVFNIQHTGVSRFQYTSFKKHTELRIPQLPEQKKIAAVLSAYDDLIENNRRRIALLERMAEQLYREWFVRFRFPGYQQAMFAKGFPSGWAMVKLGRVIELGYGKALKEEDRVPGPFPVYGSSGPIGTHTASLVEGPGIIVGRKGNVGAIHWCDSAFFPIDTAYFVKSNVSKFYLFFLLQTMNFLNNDAAVPGLSRAQAYANDVLMPPDSLIDQFERMVKPVFEQRSVLARANDQLAKTRDLLLPRLISGKLRVDDLDIQFPPSMQAEHA